MSCIGQQCPSSHAVLRLPAPSGGARSGAYTTAPPQHTATTCLRCFVESLQKGTPPPSVDEVHRGAVAIMEALVHNCPASEEGEGALLAWTCDWLTFDRDTDPCAILAFSGEVRTLHPRRMGSTLADVLVALYAYVVRHGGRVSGGRSVAATDKTGARTTLGTAAGSPHSLGRDVEDGRWVVLVDLAQFLFSCWDLLLVGLPTPLSQQVPPLHTSMAIPTSREASLQCRSAVCDCSPAGPLPSLILLGETGDGVPEEDARQCCYWEGEDKEPVQRSGSHENVAQVTAESVHDVVRRVISEIFRAADDDAATIEAGHSGGPLRSPAAAATFLKLVQVSPLLRRLVCSSPLLIRSLARYLLPRLVSLHHRQQQQQQLHHHAPGELGGKSAVAATAIEALLSTLYAVSSSAALSMSMWSAQPLPVVASQLSCRCRSSDCEMSPASSLAGSDGATLLKTLCAVLQSCCGAYPSPLRLQTLRLLHLLSSSPTTRHALFSSCCRDEVSSMFSMHEEKPDPEDAAVAAAAVSSSQRPSALDVASHLLPLLLSGEGEEESVQLSCSVLQRILLHVQSPRLYAPLSDHHNNTAHTTTTAAAGVTATFTDDGIVGTANDVSGIKAAVHLAHHIKDYAMQALYSCTCKTGYALVGLLDSAASVVAGARALLQCASIGADASAQYDDATVRWEQRQDWRIIFHVAEVDMALFGVLLQGTALHDALAQCNGACVGDDGSETRLVWDEVASSIVAVASQERGAQLSLYSFLRCLDALAAGMRGNVQALWSNRLHQLAHELLERVDGHVQDARWRPADSAAAMRTFSTLVMSGALHCNSNDESLATTAVPHVRDAADTLLLRRMVDPQTLHLLTRVTAAYLPASCDLLLPLGVQLLDDAACTGELIAIHYPVPNGYPTVTSASVEESRCLLRIATLLMRNQRESWVTPTPTFTSKEGRTRRASDDPSPAGQKPTIPPYPIPGQPHMSPYTSRGTGRSNGGADRAGLLDVLFGLYPEAPELLAARTELIHAVARGHGAAAAQPELLAARASAFVGAASLTEVAMCASDLQASLLLSLATLGCRPCVGRQELRAMLEDQCRVLCSRLQQAGFSDSTRAPVALWSAEAAEEEGDALGPAISETASDRDGDDDDAGLLLDTLQEVFILFVVRMLWHGGAESDPSQPLPSPSLQASATDAAADCFFTEAHAHALMMCVEDSVGLREGLRQLLFDLHTQYRLDVRGFLTLLQSEKDHVPRQRPQQAQAPSSALFAAAVLSVILYDGDEPGLSTAQAGAASPLRTYMRSLRSVHWLTDTSSQEAGVPFSVGLLLRSVFRVARRELLSLDGLQQHPQEQPADAALATIAAFPAVIGGLHFVCDELAFQQRGLQGGTLPVRRVGEELAAREDVVVSAPGSSPGVALSICVLREHLAPFLLCTNSSSSVAHRKNLSMAVAALQYSTVLLQLMSLALWPLAPATCTSVDAVLTEYAMSRARQLLALTTAELTRADGAARKLLYPLLQLLYLLLMRAHKVDVVRRYGTDLLFFAFRARHAALTRAHLIVFGEVEQGSLTDSDEDSAQVCVIASIVYIMAQQIAAPRRKGATGDIEIRSVEDVARAASGGAAAVGGGGLEPPSRKDMPWYVWIPVLRYYWCLRTAVSRTANGHAVREQRRSVLRILVSGVEYVIRLCGVSHLACCSHSAAHVGKDPDRDERQAATILIDWCTELIFTSWRSGDDFNDAHPNGTIVAARLLYLLFYRFRALAANSVWFNALVLSCMRQTAPSRLLRLPLAAEGWLLAALIQVLPYVQHSRAYGNYVKGSAATFFERPEIAVRVKLLPHPPPKEAATAGAARLVGACGGWADVSAAEPELSCVLRILVTACREYELSPHRLRSSSSLEVIAPLGLQFVEEAPIRECPSVLEYAFPYTVPITTTAAPPLLLVFRCFADQIHV